MDIIEGVADGAAGIARLAGGALADDPDRRRATALGGYSATAGLSSAIGVATSVGQVGVLRAGSWAARGLRVPARNALLADATPPEAFGRAYGFERMMDNLGAIGGPLLALALVAAFSVRTAIVVSVIPGLLAAVAILYGIRRIPRLGVHERQRVRLQVGPLLRGRLGRLLGAAGAFELGNVAATLLILRATVVLRPAHGTAGATEVALLLYTAYNAAATLVSLPAGHLTDRVGPVKAWTLGAGAFLASYLLFATGRAGLPVLALAFILAGIGIGCAETAESAAVAAASPPELRGSAFGMLAGVQAFGNLAASAVAGVLWSVVSPTTAFLYLAVWMLVAVGVLTLTG